MPGPTWATPSASGALSHLSRPPGPRMKAIGESTGARSELAFLATHASGATYPASREAEGRRGAAVRPWCTEVQLIEVDCTGKRRIVNLSQPPAC